MTPQEMSDYKQKWKPGFTVQVDTDSDVWGKNFCKKHYKRETWGFSPFTMPDDSHSFLFEDLVQAIEFLAEYEQHNDSFPARKISQLPKHWKPTDEG